MAAPDGIAVLRQPSFRLFLLSRVSSTLASQMIAVAVGWQIYALSGSTLYLGLVGLAQFLPMFLLTLVVGQVADRHDRRTIARTCQLIEALATAFLAVSTLRGWVSTDSILVTVLLIGSARAFEGPSMQALLPGLVSAKIFPRATAWSTSATETAAIVGPALGGALYVAGPTVVYAAAAALLAAASIFMAALRGRVAAARGGDSTATPNRGATLASTRRATSLKSLFAGIAFIRSRPVIFGAISLDLFAVLLGGATALLPAYARDILFVGPIGLGILRAAPSLGALGMSFFLAQHPLRRSVGRTMFIAVIVFGLGTIVFAFSHSIALSLGALVVLGGADVISMVIRSALVQLGTPDEMRGRVSAVNSLFIGTSNQLGEFESGITASWFGLVPAVLIGGIGTIVVVLLFSRLFPDLARADSLEAP